MSGADYSLKFTFDHAPVRGLIVRLEVAWRELNARQDYGPSATRLLGDLAVATAAMAQDLKFEGRLITQIRTTDATTGPPLSTAMAECRGGDTLRAIVRGPALESATGADDLIALFGPGDLAITLRPDHGETYQGVVAIGAGTIGTHIERYFHVSEQLPTRLWLCNDARVAAGLLLQRLPGAVVDDAVVDDWRRIGLLADTLGADELLHLPPERLLARLFHGDRLRLHPPRPLHFGCSCTRERSSNALRLLGASAVGEILEADGRVEVKCEFCGATYAYDAVDAAALLRDVPDATPSTIH